MCALKRTVGVFVLTSALSSCASMGATWYRDGATQADYNHDHYDCEKDMRQGGNYGTGIIGMVTGSTADDFFSRCMVAKGWRAG